MGFHHGELHTRRPFRGSSVVYFFGPAPAQLAPAGWSITTDPLGQTNDNRNNEAGNQGQANALNVVVFTHEEGNSEGHRNNSAVL